MNAPTKYKTLPSIRVRDRKHTGHGVLNAAVRRLDRFEGDVPSLTRKLKNTQPKTRRGKAAKTVLLASAGTLKRTGKYALAAENAAVSVTYSAAKKTARKAAGAAAGAVKNKLHSKAEESLGGYSFYLKAAGVLPTAKEIKQYIKQKKSYQLETAKAKLLKAESKMNRLETKQPKSAKLKPSPPSQTAQNMV